MCVCCLAAMFACVFVLRESLCCLSGITCVCEVCGLVHCVCVCSRGLAIGLVYGPAWFGAPGWLEMLGLGGD